MRQPRWLDDTSRFLLLFGVVLVANSVLSYAYTKDEIVSIAGVFYAFAAFAAMRVALIRLEHLPGTAGIALLLLLSVVSAGWAVRASGVHYLLRTQAFRQQNDWVQLPGEWRREDRWPTDPAAEALIRQLHRDAVSLVLPNTRVDVPEWPGSIWED